jgi:hypothetical protein
MPVMPDGSYQYGDTTIQKTTVDGTPTLTGIGSPPPAPATGMAQGPNTASLQSQVPQFAQQYQSMASGMPESVRSTIQQYMPDYRNLPQPSMFSPQSYWDSRSQEAQELRSMIQRGLTTSMPGQRLTADGLSILMGRLNELDRGNVEMNREWMGQTGALSRTALQDQGALVRTLADRQLAGQGVIAAEGMRGTMGLLSQQQGALLGDYTGENQLRQAQRQYYDVQAQANRPEILIPPPTDLLGNPLPPTDPQARKINVANSVLLNTITQSQGNIPAAANTLSAQSAIYATAMDMLSRAVDPKNKDEAQFLNALQERAEVANLALGRLTSVYGPEVLASTQVDPARVRESAARAVYDMLGYGQGKLSAKTLNRLNQVLGQPPQGYADGGVVTPPPSALGMPVATAPGTPAPVNLDVMQRYQQYVALAQKMGLPPVSIDEFLTSTAGAGAGAQPMPGAQPTPPMPQMQPQAGAAVPGNPITSALQQFADGGLVGGPQLDGKLVVDPNPASGRDSIPAVIDGMHPARLDSGEMVIPRDVVMYYGTKTLQQMIDKARGASNGERQQ